MRFALMTEPQQGLSYQQVLSLARLAEELGFEAFFRSDHYTSFPGERGLPTTDAWATLAGLARETSRIRLGALVSPVTFRVPGSFAKVVMTVDEMSGGRVEVGVGAGWNDGEHAELGIPFPELQVRVDQMEEELAILRGLWDEPDGWSYEGRHWQVRDALLRPKERPADMRPDGRRRPNLILGGTDKPRALRLAAAHADEYNISSTDPEGCRRIRDRLAEECGAIGRDPATLEVSVMVGVLIGRDDTELRQRAAAQIAIFGAEAADGEAWLAERRKRWIIGTPDAARARLADYIASGIDRIVLQCFLPHDLEHIRFQGEVLLG